MATQRMIRINEEMKKEISATINRGIKDPRVQDVLISIVEVDATNDLKTAKVYVSILAEDEKREDVMKGLKAAGGYIRREIARKINLRNTPELLFELDNSIEYSAKMFKKIDEVLRESEQ
ncbi:MAG TPA: 30S ribosome-binding factor RbfA [Epulopiscium sp.]|nr:30S ribosome-binding factor RbfA [Candidatus Epulonipiscium sp.]